MIVIILVLMYCVYKVCDMYADMYLLLLEEKVAHNELKKSKEAPVVQIYDHVHLKAANTFYMFKGMKTFEEMKVFRAGFKYENGDTMIYMNFSKN